MTIKSTMALASLGNVLRHAFMVGAGYGDLEKISDADLKRWAEYDPESAGPAWGRVELALAGIDGAEVFTIDNETTRRVFQANGITNVSDLQAVLDAVEKALVAKDGDGGKSEGTPTQYGYELAKSFNSETGEYSNWGNREYSEKMPNVPEGSIRNVSRLYEAHWLEKPPVAKAEPVRTSTGWITTDIPAITAVAVHDIVKRLNAGDALRSADEMAVALVLIEGILSGVVQALPVTASSEALERGMAFSAQMRPTFKVMGVTV